MSLRATIDWSGPVSHRGKLRVIRWYWKWEGDRLPIAVSTTVERFCPLWRLFSFMAHVSTWAVLTRKHFLENNALTLEGIRIIMARFMLFMSITRYWGRGASKENIAHRFSLACKKRNTVLQTNTRNRRIDVIFICLARARRVDTEWSPVVKFAFNYPFIVQLYFTSGSLLIFTKRWSKSRGTLTGLNVFVIDVIVTRQQTVIFAQYVCEIFHVIKLEYSRVM